MIYQTLKAAIEGILPEGWAFTPYEPAYEMPDVTTVTMKVRTVARLQAAPVGHYRVDWVLTVTTPYTSRQTADPTLFDDLIDFLTALDEEEGLSWLGWTNAEKTVGDDLERLAYDITIYTLTQKEGA